MANRPDCLPSLSANQVRELNATPAIRICNFELLKCVDLPDAPAGTEKASPTDSSSDGLAKLCACNEAGRHLLIAGHL
ncbi:MAG: hypothetical protein ACLFUJ_06055 [Phycisphaerae bacterium]